ncbi:MAG: ABC transporter permease subunit [Firmicutes bacterium]|nr:ABC transporter permease subunit [Bacillota bacterium]
MPVFRRELQANSRSWLVWTIALAALNLLMMWVFPSFRQDTANMEAVMELFPEAFAKIFGLDQLSLADPIGFYATEAYFMVMLFGSLYAAILGASILSKEEDDKTIEFLLARPISRTRLLAGKLLALLTLLVLFNLVIGLVTFAAFAIFDVGEYSAATLLRLLTTPFLAHITFAAFAFCLALFFIRRKSATSMAIGMVVGLYFVDVLATLSDKFELLRYLTPYHYVNAVDIVHNGIDPVNVLVLLGATAVAVGTSFFLYRRRDITV